MTHTQENERGSIEARMHIDECNTMLTVCVRIDGKGDKHFALCALSAGDHYVSFAHFMDGALLSLDGIDCAEESYTVAFERETKRLALRIEFAGFCYARFMAWATEE